LFESEILVEKIGRHFGTVLRSRRRVPDKLVP
jgi:hypothetical protein